jgi:hypothetical protein
MHADQNAPTPTTLEATSNGMSQAHSNKLAIRVLKEGFISCIMKLDLHVRKDSLPPLWFPFQTSL